MANADKAKTLDPAPRRANDGETHILSRIPFRKPPAMRVVTKGWLTMDEREVDIGTLKKQG